MPKEQKMKTINIRGKEYVTVDERIRLFNENYPNGIIQSHITYEGEFVRCKAIVVPDVEKPARMFNGHAEEDRRQGNINKTNATENCETSAIGRALAMMGIGIVSSVASADEVAHAIFKQDSVKYNQPGTRDPAKFDKEQQREYYKKIIDERVKETVKARMFATGDWTQEEIDKL